MTATARRYARPDARRASGGPSPTAVVALRQVFKLSGAVAPAVAARLAGYLSATVSWRSMRRRTAGATETSPPCPR